jgi:hypothetical protein
VTPAVVPQANAVNHLDLQTTPKPRTELQTLSATVTNRDRGMRGGPPDPETRSPARAGHQGEAKTRSPEATKSYAIQSQETSSKRRSFTVTDGTALAGHVVEYVELRFKATDPSGKTIGVFSSLKEAMAALPSMAGGGL